MTDKPISKDLFLALLAMDAYNRGYGPGVADMPDKNDRGVAVSPLRTRRR